MLQDNHDNIINHLISIKEDLGGIKTDVNNINKRLDTLNGQVAKHASFINTWKGKLAVISAVAGSVGSLLVLYIKKHLNL